MQRLSRAGVVSIVAATANITAVARRHRGVAQLLRVPRFQTRTMAAAATAAAPAAGGGGAGGGAGVGGGTAADASAATSVPQFCDIGANLLDTMFQGEYHGKQKHEPDVEQVLQRAWDAGVCQVIITGVSMASSGEALELAKTNPKLYSTVGVHPTNCGELAKADEEGVDGFTKLLQTAQAGVKAGKVVAVGECGLDYDRLEFCPKDVQLKYFEKHFELAQKTGLPMFLHCRNAGMDMANLLRTNQERFSRAVVHSFDGTSEELKALLEFDNVYIGINGCSLRSAENLEVAASIPEDRLLLETDAPWCGIRPSHAGSSHIKTTWKSVKNARHKPDDGCLVKGRNEPCCIRQVAEVLATARGVEVEHLAAVAYATSAKVFFPHADKAS